MPLARIITDSVDDSLELTIQLRARGFQVETVTPGQVPNTPVDLEVRLEECAPEEVLSRAAETPTKDDLWVFVAPGTLDERVRVIREAPVQPANVPEIRGAAPLPKVPTIAPLIPFLAPEDDPILADLAELRASAQDSQRETPAEEPSRERAEIVVFPAAAPAHEVATVAVRAGLEQSEVSAFTHERASAPANLLFWRIATVTAGLAIAALLVGANMSRERDIPAPSGISAMSTTMVPLLPPILPRPPKVQAEKTARATRTSPPTPPGVSPHRGSSKLAKAAHPRTGKPFRHAASSHANDVIAEDTVVFYDRKPSLPASGTRKGAGRN